MSIFRKALDVDNTSPRGAIHYHLYLALKFSGQPQAAQQYKDAADKMGYRPTYEQLLEFRLNRTKP